MLRFQPAQRAHAGPAERRPEFLRADRIALRQKIGEDARAPKTLRTVHGEGYVFDPDA